VNARNGRKFDTTQNSEEAAHRPDSDSRNASTLAPPAVSRRSIPLASKNVR
jgi:hypothetical protein